MERTMASGVQVKPWYSLPACIDQGNLGGQLQVDQKVDVTVDLVPQRHFLRGYDLLKDWNIPQAQCEQLLVNIRSSLYVILSFRISHSIVVRGVLLD